MALKQSKAIPTQNRNSLFFRAQVYNPTKPLEAAFTPTQLPRKNRKTIKMANEVTILWRLVAVGNGWLWLTPCKRMKLRRSEWAQLGDCTKEGMSLVEGRLWSKLWSYYNRPSPTLTTLFGSVSKLRSQASLHGVNHNMPFPTALKPFFSTFSELSIPHHTMRAKQNAPHPHFSHKSEKDCCT